MTVEVSVTAAGLTTSDPGGYTAVDVLVGGSQGHVVAVGVVLGLRALGVLVRFLSRRSQRHMQPENGQRHLGRACLGCPGAVSPLYNVAMHRGFAPMPEVLGTEMASVVHGTTPLMSNIPVCSELEELRGARKCDCQRKTRG